MHQFLANTSEHSPKGVHNGKPQKQSEAASNGADESVEINTQNLIIVDYSVPGGADDHGSVIPMRKIFGFNFVLDLLAGFWKKNTTLLSQD